MNEVVTRPWAVALGCAVSLGISVWDIVSAVFEEEVVEASSFVMVLLVLSVIPIIFTLAAFFRRNWGRIVLAVIAGLSVASVPVSELLGEEMAVPLDSETVLYVLANGVVVMLLFLPASNDWYRKPRARLA